MSKPRKKPAARKTSRTPKASSGYEGAQYTGLGDNAAPCQLGAG